LFSEARAICKFARDLFTTGEADCVDILFTNFISTLSQRPEVLQLLPVGQIKTVSAGFRGESLAEELPSGSGTEFLFEPSADAVLGAMLPHYLNFRIYQILLEAKASEHSARMVAMKNATDNAQELIKHLTLEYNKMRQAAITNELLEISTAQMAMG
jgi:F-type H+-transporting ATPase subunit gamma